MENDLLGYERFGLVIDKNDFHIDTMHLLSYFNTISENEVMLMDLSAIEGNKDPRRKLDL